IVTSTAGAFGALSTMITGLRSVGNNTPVLNSWAGDGTYWLPANPKVTNYWFVTFASSFGDDPSKAVNRLAKQVKAATGGFITGPSAVDGVVTAIKRAHGSTKGIVLARVMEHFKNVPTISGNVSFSPKLHTVFGRRYRVIRIQNNVPKVVGPNGAGKSTLVNVLSGFDLPSSGAIELEGRDITRWRPSRRGRAGLARTFQHSHAFRSLSVRENVEVAALGAGTPPRAARERAEELLAALALSANADAPADALAQGDERRLGVAR